ncbi:Unannotated [Lentimonas sp. CC4]|nr:Unannotated [Lentimonas sp. CC4]CAA6683833.1 Unannotated [Lentimonas sp. CC6]CAA7077769.1 Unannotated [Lentimonas sp. CC4]CAA7169703.1 Unannotated [Lentimonas sp. CC21]CAA7179524.1 Unannotated [Lentimonas sp. CC8]
MYARIRYTRLSQFDLRNEVYNLRKHAFLRQFEFAMMATWTSRIFTY